ncbi:MAG: tyrosine-type recombinase/integrase [Actinomycetota bacterium]
MSSKRATKARRASSGAFTNDDGKTWGVILEHGVQDCQRCDACRKNLWLDLGLKDACPKCGGELRSHRARRTDYLRPVYPTKTAAKEARLKLQSQVHDSEYVKPSAETVGEYLRDWVEGIKGEIEPTTWINYKGHVYRHIIPSLGPIKVAKLTRERVAAFYVALLDKPSANGQRNLSKTTVQRVHATLHRALQDLVDDNRLKRNPADRAKPKTTKTEKSAKDHRLAVWDFDELDAFLDLVVDDELFALWRLYGWTGIRRGEGAAVQLGDVDLDAKTLTVRRALSVVSYEVHVTAPKSGQGRVIDLDDETVDALRAHVTRMKTDRMALGLGKPNRNDWLFGHIDGTFTHPDSISKRFTKLIERSGLPKLRLHDLRHTHASHLLLNGANIKVVQERLGHASVTITLDTYGHLLPTTQREAINALAKRSKVVNLG